MFSVPATAVPMPIWGLPDGLLGPTPATAAAESHAAQGHGGRGGAKAPAWLHDMGTPEALSSDSDDSGGRSPLSNSKSPRRESESKKSRSARRAADRAERRRVSADKKALAGQMRGRKSPSLASTGRKSPRGDGENSALQVM